MQQGSCGCGCGRGCDDGGVGRQQPVVSECLGPRWCTSWHVSSSRLQLGGRRVILPVEKEVQVQAGKMGVSRGGRKERAKKGID